MKKMVGIFSLLGLLGVVLYLVMPQREILTSAPKLSEEPSKQLPRFDITIEGIRQTQIEDTTITIDSEYQSQAAFTSYLAHYTSNGLRINGLLTIPTTEQPEKGFPAIVFLHGYIPPTSYQTTSRYVDYVNYLARSGFVVFKIDYRGHGESEGEPGGAYFSADYVLDTLPAINALQHFDKVNSDVIGVWGHSMSGNVALRTAVVQPAVKAVVIWAGAVYSYSDFTAYRLNDASYVRPTSPTQSNRSQRLFDEVGGVDPATPFWQAMAPTNYLDQLAGPTQIHHAQDDAVVNIEYSRELNAALEKAQKEHQLFEYTTGGHNISGSSFSTAMRRTVDFFTTHLQ